MTEEHSMVGRQDSVAKHEALERRGKDVRGWRGEIHDE
jgi:hypothetical protein